MLPAVSPLVLPLFFTCLLSQPVLFFRPASRCRFSASCALVSSTLSTLFLVCNRINHLFIPLAGFVDWEQNSRDASPANLVNIPELICSTLISRKYCTSIRQAFVRNEWSQDEVCCFHRWSVYYCLQMRQKISSDLPFLGDEKILWDTRRRTMMNFSPPLLQNKGT